MPDDLNKISPVRFLAEALANLDTNITGVVLILHSPEQTTIHQNGCSEDEMIFSAKMILDGLFEETE